MSLQLKHSRHPHFLLILTFGILALTSCQSFDVEQQAPSPTLAPSVPQTPETGSIEFTQAEIDSLESLEKVDEHPLFVMYYQGPYLETTFIAPGSNVQGFYVETNPHPAWACSLFTSLADPQSGVFGRNFDWEFSPALLLFTDPPNGYASVSMVDLAYFFEPSTVHELMDLDLNDRSPLLDTPSMPFDGMNEKGLVIGMAAVPDSPTPSDPNNESAGSLRVIRMLLDHAASVEEALLIMRGVNILWSGGPPLHYLIADTHGKAALVEFVAGEMVVLYNTNPWHQATNFLLSNTSGSADGVCNRYDLIKERLQKEQGDLSPEDAMELLAEVSQSSTQWSIVYQLFTGRISLAMGRSYSEIHAFKLEASSIEN